MGRQALYSAPPPESGQRLGENLHALLSVLQELTVAALELFDPKTSADVFLDRVAERLGCYAALLFEIHPEGAVSLQSAAGLSPTSRDLPIPEEAARAIARDRTEYDLSYPELDRASLARWSFPVTDPDPASPDWALLLCFNGEPHPKQLRSMVQRLVGILRTVLVHRNLFARTIESERRLDEALRARDDFLTIASHELRTPLTSMQLLVQSGLHAARNEPEASPSLPRLSLECIERQMRRLNKLIDALLDVSLIRAGRLSLELETTDLRAVTREVLSRFRDELGRSGSTLSLLAEAPVPGRWDRSRLDQVVTNLLSNAIKYGCGNPIEIRLETDPGRARLILRDRGLGIPTEHLPQMFKKFARASSTRQYGGLGLGLHIVRQIVEMHGGTVEVESEAGVGSTFTVELPLQGPQRSPDRPGA